MNEKKCINYLVIKDNIQKFINELKNCFKVIFIIITSLFHF